MKRSTERSGKSSHPVKKRRAEKRGIVADTVLLYLDAFATLILAGTKPPPELERFVARRIKRYLDATGRLSLDDSFSLRSAQRVGRPASRALMRKARASALARIIRIKISEGGSFERAIELFLHEAKGLVAPESNILNSDILNSDPVTYMGARLTKESLVDLVQTDRAQGLLDAQTDRKRDVKR